MIDHRWFAIAVFFLFASTTIIGCARGTRPKYTIEAAKKELQELDAARKKEWTPPDQ